MQVNKLDSAIDLVAKLSFLLGETFFQIGEVVETQEEFDFYNVLSQMVENEWEDNKPVEYVVYSEWCD